MYAEKVNKACELIYAPDRGVLVIFIYRIRG